MHVATFTNISGVSKTNIVCPKFQFFDFLYQNDRQNDPDLMTYILEQTALPVRRYQQKTVILLYVQIPFFDSNIVCPDIRSFLLHMWLEQNTLMRSISITNIVCPFFYHILPLIIEFGHILLWYCTPKHFDQYWVYITIVYTVKKRYQLTTK